MMMIRIFISFSFVFLLFGTLNAATGRDSTEYRNVPIWSVAGYYGNFIRHSPKLTTRTGQWLYGGEVGFSMQTRGRKAWHSARNFPETGISVIWLNPGAGAHGQLAGIFPHLTLPLARYAKSGIYFRVGAGWGYAQRPHNSFSNPGENALGSHSNSVVQFRFHYSRSFWDYWKISAGTVLTHFSNGGFELPNYGMNIPGFFAGIAFLPHKNINFSPKKSTRKPDKRWGGSLQTYFSRIEYISLDGPKYLVWSVSGGATWMPHRFNRVYGGLEWEHNAGVEAWLRNNTLLGDDPEQAYSGANRLGFYVADEFLIGPVGIYLQGSYHIGRAPLNTFVIANNYNKLAARYYLPSIKKLPVRCNIGVALKAYRAVAESISLTTGVVF